MFQKLSRAFGALTLSALLLIVAAPASVFAEERTCRGTIGATTVDNLRVPDGATCILNGTKVKGTIKVETGAVLKAYDVRVIGNVQGEDAKKVVVRDNSYIGGSFQVVQSRVAKVLDSRIVGDILIDDNRGLNVIRRNVVGEDVQAFQNSGGVEIFGNRIDGNLQCKANSPRPVGNNNVVGGVKQDQCKGF